ncbi:MAG: peptidoglycan DD-metalloendopeptidase family protein [Bryobacterales bacterium]|nr:peptidoglycan DD-metalloendopeptidase family protein [Bryobacterales bacterium]
MYPIQRTTLLVLTAGALGVAGTLLSLRSNLPLNPDPPALEEVLTAPPEPEPTVETLPIRSGDNLAGLLARAGVQTQDSAAMVAAIGKAFDVRKFRSGTDLTLTRAATGQVDGLEYSIDADHRLEVSRQADGFAAAVLDIPGFVRETRICGVLDGSLFDSIGRTGESPLLAIRLAEIFAWDIDFYRDPQPGDQFCMLIEKKEYGDGAEPTYRRILAARYVNSGTTYEAHLFPDAQGKPQYYSPDGKSLQAAFLRSPLPFEARVSSHFSRNRRHPVLGVHRPHLGTDYAAPTGTPVQSVAAGRVVFSGYSRGAGNMVRIQHTGGYESRYLHLSRRLVRPGQQIGQGQRIGLVGATGLATGPHLDFRLLKNGAHMDFERIRPPRATEIQAAQRPLFQALRERHLALLVPAFQTGGELADGL